MTWAEPYWLILLVFMPLPWLLSRRIQPVVWPTLDSFAPTPTFKTRIKWALPFIIRALVIAALALALTRPRTVGGYTRIAAKGVAIVVAIDQSSSMKATDAPNSQQAVSRLETAKATLARFIAKRPDDLLGLVVFANYPDLTCPLTLDHALIQDRVKAISQARANDDGTNLGDAIICGLNALKGASPPKKVLVLLTDGHNSPAVPQPADPEFAADLAAKMGVTLHTIAVGGAGGSVAAVEPVTQLPIQGEVDGPDLKALEKIAGLGGGQAFHATNPSELAPIFDTIDLLEKSPIQSEIRTRYNENFGLFAASALVLLVVDRWLAAGLCRRLP